MATATTPLTTVFTPPPNCASHWTFEPSASDGNDVPGGLLLERAQGPPFAPLSALDTTCYPDIRGGWGRYPAGFDYYSTPGTLNGATATVVFYGCTSLYDSDETPTSVFAISPYGSFGTLDGTAARATEITGPITMWAQPITVAYQQRDVAILPASTTTATTSSLTSSPSSNPVASSSSALTTTQPTAPTQDPPPQALSNGAIAGIAIGGIALLALVIGVLVLLWRKKKRSKSSPLEMQVDSTYTSPSSFESKFEPNQYHGHAELETPLPVRRHELDAVPH